jgi:hypothetical protein
MMEPFGQAAAVVAIPLVMTTAFAASWMRLVALHASQHVVPVLLTAAIVTILELVLPHRRRWRRLEPKVGRTSCS